MKIQHMQFSPNNSSFTKLSMGLTLRIHPLVKYAFYQCQNKMYPKSSSIRISNVKLIGINANGCYFYSDMSGIMLLAIQFWSFARECNIGLIGVQTVLSTDDFLEEEEVAANSLEIRLFNYFIERGLLNHQNLIVVVIDGYVPLDKYYFRSKTTETLS